MFSRRAVTAALLGVLLASCANVSGSGGQLEGTQWVLSSYAQGGTLSIVPETIFADATFEGSIVGGQAGCNTFRALYQSGSRTLLISQASTTLMACDEPTMDFAQTYLALLQSSRFYTVRNETLTIYDSIGSPALVFDAAPRNPVLGRWNVDSFLIPPSTVTAPIAGTQLDVVFGIASVGGSAGCNSFTGTYGTNGTALRISPLATTRLACDQTVMDQETAFLSALQGVSFIDYRGDTVLLTDRDGHLVVGLTRPTPTPEASASPSASAAPVASATPKPSASATPKPSASPSPTPTPTPSPTPAPSKTPGASASALPPLPSIPPLPAAGTCDLAPAAGGAAVAKLVYPGTWNTVTTPANLACRYFDPKPITVPADPATLQTAVMANVLATPYADAVTAATNPANWTVARQGSSTVSGTPFTCVDATALVATAGVPVGSSAFSCLVNVGAAGTVVIQTIGTAGDANVRGEAARSSRS